MKHKKIIIAAAGLLVLLFYPYAVLADETSMSLS